MGPRIVPVLRCVWCAPTARAVVAVSPFVPLGGAAGLVARVASPWQLVQLPPDTSTMPLTCLPPATLMLPSAFMVAGWHWAQAVSPPVTDGWPLVVGGGTPWHVPQAACEASKRGMAQPVVASVPKVRSRTPLGWPLVEAGTR